MSTLADVMGVVAAVSVAVLLYTGSLVTRRTRDTIEAERDKWRALHDRNHFVRATTRNPYRHHGCHRVPAVVRVRAAITGEVVAGICLRCDKQVDAREADVWGVDE